MPIQSRVVWQDEMAFNTELDGFDLTIDAASEFGGRDLGPRPKGLLLTSLAGCTAMDVKSILGKMRVALDGLVVEVEGELAEEHPKKFVRIVLRYRFAGEDLPANKLRRAVRLSEEQYCGVRTSLDPAIEVVNQLFVNGEPLASTPAAE